MEPMIPLERLETFANGLDHAEGICLAPDGHLYVGGEDGQLYRIVDDEAEEVMTTGGFLLGLAADAESNIYACDQTARCVWKLVPSTGERIVFTKGLDGHPMRVPNWGCFDAEGNYYVSDSGGWQEANGLIWVVRPGGATQIWSDECVDFPNGMAVAPDGSHLYVLESTPPRLVRVPIGNDGSAGTREVVTELPGTVPDGVALTADGAFVISCYRPDVVYIWDPDAGLMTLVEDPQGTTIAAPTNVVFTGGELDVMVVPNLGRWHLTRIRADIVGTPLFYPTFSQLAG